MASAPIEYESETFLEHWNSGKVGRYEVLLPIHMNVFVPRRDTGASVSDRIQALKSVFFRALPSVFPSMVQSCKSVMVRYP